MSINFTTELFKVDYRYKVKIVGHIASKLGGNPQYIAISHGKIFNLLSSSFTYNSDGKEDIITGVKVYEIDIAQLYDICKKQQFVYYLPFSKVPYKDTREYSKYRKICFDNFDIFCTKSVGVETVKDEYYIRVNLCWEETSNENFLKLILEQIT